MKNFVSVSEIKKGWSGDKKYRVVDKDGNTFFLRASSLEKAERKKQEFEMAKKVANLGISMCLPEKFYIGEDAVYTLYSWINGSDARDVLSSFPLQEQYSYGIEAGKFQRSLHTISAPQGLLPWESKYNKKLDNKLEKYNNCPLKYEKGNLFIDFINKNRHLLANRPLTYQHGDYHVGNMMIGTDKQLYVIDFFDRNDYGDPWEDIKSITWDVAASPMFAKGRIDGYFNGDVPADFWKLLALYISSGILSSLPWAIPFGQGEIEVMQNLAQDVLNRYKDFSVIIPTWYTDN